jgi:hypothetical protein
MDAWSAMAEAICTRALVEGRCAELLEVIFAGGSATVDAATGNLVLVSAEQLRAMAGAR